MKIFIFSFFLFVTTFFSQIKKKNLIGEWAADKTSFYSADTIKFYRESKSCHQIIWYIGRRKFHSNVAFMCEEPTRGIVNPVLEKLKLKKKDFGQIIELYQNGILMDKFRIVELQKSNNSILKLMRFDKLSDQKLYKYVDSLIYKVLKFKPELKQNKTKSNVSKFRNKNTGEYQIRCSATIIDNPEPLIIINGIPVKNRNILKELLLVETYAIRYLTKISAASLYGTKAFNGVIILKTSEKRFKKVLKKYL